MEAPPKSRAKQPPYRTQFFTLVEQDSSSSRLPNFELVRKDAVRAPDLREAKQRGFAPPVLLKDRITGVILNDPIPDCLYFQLSCQYLFKWSHIVHTDDVPKELLKECIWALEQFIAVVHECSDDQLFAIGMITTDQLLPNEIEKRRRFIDVVKKLQVMQARIKLARHIIKPAINRPKDAAFQLGLAMKFLKDARGAQPGAVAPLPERLFFVDMAGMLFQAGDDSTGRAAVEHALPVTDTSGQGLREVIMVKAAVAKMYRAHEMIKDARVHETWLVQWFKKNPHLMLDEDLRSILFVSGKPSAVLEALGGPEWLESRQPTDKSELRRSKQCRQCGSREPFVKLSVCSGCQKIWYCSRECLKKNWPSHKVFCQDQATTNKNIERAQAVNPQEAQKRKDFSTWLEIKDMTPYAHATGLHRDANRARTHMIFQEVIYTPKASSWSAEKFLITRCGVFKMDEVYRVIERVMGLDPGEGVEYVDSMLDLDSSRPGAKLLCSVVVLTMGKGLSAWLGEAPIPETYLEDSPYRADWRNLLNSNSVPPKQFVLADGAIQDREHDF